MRETAVADEVIIEVESDIGAAVTDAEAEEVASTRDALVVVVEDEAERPIAVEFLRDDDFDDVRFEVDDDDGPNSEFGKKSIGLLASSVSS